MDSDYNIMTFLGKLDEFNRQLVFNWVSQEKKGFKQ